MSFNGSFFLNRFPVCFILFVLLFLVTLHLVVAVQKKKSAILHPRCIATQKQWCEWTLLAILNWKIWLILICSFHDNFAGLCLWKSLYYSLISLKLITAKILTALLVTCEQCNEQPSRKKNTVCLTNINHDLTNIFKI